MNETATEIKPEVKRGRTKSVKPEEQKVANSVLNGEGVIEQPKQAKGDQSHYMIPKADFEAMVTALKMNRPQQWVGVALVQKVGKWLGAKTFEECQQVCKEISDKHFKRQEGGV